MFHISFLSFEIGSLRVFFFPHPCTLTIGEVEPEMYFHLYLFSWSGAEVSVYLCVCYCTFVFVRTVVRPWTLCETDWDANSAELFLSTLSQYDGRSAVRIPTLHLNLNWHSLTMTDIKYKHSDYTHPTAVVLYVYESNQLEAIDISHVQWVFTLCYSHRLYII